MYSPDSVAALLRRTFLQHSPSRHARMTEAHSDAKYLRVQGHITDQDLRAHVAGSITLALPLATDGSAYAAACDIDAGGEDAIRRVMRAAEAAGCHPVGFVLNAGDHNGGHVWLFFAQAHPDVVLRQVISEITTAAAVPQAELWPSGQDLRLPFGVHRRCNQRGRLLTSSTAPVISIDADPQAAIAAFQAHFRYSPSASVAAAAQRLAVQQAQASAEQAAARARYQQRHPHDGAPPSGTQLIHHYNATTSLVQLLESYGATVAAHYSGGAMLLHCASARDHTHGDAHPSLVVSPGRAGQNGKLVCACKSPRCRLHTEPGRVLDAFGVFCTLEGITFGEGVKRIAHARPPEPGSSTTPPPQTPPTPPGAAPPSTLAQRDTAAAATPAAWRAGLAAQLRSIRADRRVSPSGYRLYQYLVEQCIHSPRCRPSNAKAGAALNVVPDTIKLRKRELATLGYITVDRTQCRTGFDTAIVHLIVPEKRVFNPRPPTPPTAAPPEGGVISFPQCGNEPPVAKGGGVIKRSPDKESLNHTSLTWEGGGQESPAAAASSAPANLSTAHASADEPVGHPSASPAAVVANPEGASFTPAAPRRPLPTNPRVRAGEIRARRCDKLRGLALEEVQRQRLVMARTAAKASGRQRAALDGQVREIDAELSRRRGAGMQAMWETTGAPAASAGAPAAPVASASAGPPPQLAEPRPPSPPPSQVVSDAALRSWGRDFLGDEWRALQEAQARRAEERGDQQRAGFIRAAAGLSGLRDSSNPVVCSKTFQNTQQDCDARSRDVNTECFGFRPISADAAAVAVGDRTAAMSEQAGQLVTGGAFVEASIDALSQVGFSEQAAQTVQSLGRDTEFVAGVTDRVLELAGQSGAIQPEPVASLGDCVEGDTQRSSAGAVVLHTHEALSAALRVARPHGYVTGDAIQVGLAEPCDLLVAQPGGGNESRHMPKLCPTGVCTLDVRDHGGSLVVAVPAARARLAQTLIESSWDQLLGRDGVPAGGVEGMAEFAPAGQLVTDGAVGQAVGDHQAPQQLDVFGVEVAQEAQASIRWQSAVDAPQASDHALPVGAGALVAVDLPSRGAGGFGGVAALADVADAFKDFGYLPDEARGLAHRGAPGCDVGVGRGPPGV